MTDYFTPQFDGDGGACDGRNCAAASGAMAVAAATGNRVQLTADQFRAASGMSCVPGVHSASGGLFTSDVARVALRYGVTIDYGYTDAGITRYTAPTQRARLSAGYGAVLLGDYDQIRSPFRTGSFTGDHSVYVHNYREDLPAYGRSYPEPTVCWHDPLRKAPIRIPWAMAVSYNHKPGSPVFGLTGWVKLPVPTHRIQVRRLYAFWRYLPDGTREKHRSYRGFSGTCTAPVKTQTDYGEKRLVTVTSGAYSKWLLDADNTPPVTVTEA